MAERTDFYRIDDEKEHIRRVQRWLRELSRADKRLPEIFIDGIYGTETENAVREFQKTRELTPTGALDKATFDKIFSEYTALATNKTAFGYTPEFEYYEANKMTAGDDFDDIFLLQLLLRRLAVKDERFFIEMTGKYDPPTENAVKLLRSVSDKSDSEGVDIPLWNDLIRLTETLEGYI